MIKKCKKGQSLIEVLVAISIASLVALGLVRATGASISNSGYSRDQSSANDLAQKKIAEKVDLKNQDPEAFFSSLPTSAEETLDDFCVKTRVTSVAINPVVPDPAAKMAKVTVDVYWNATVDGTDCDGKDYKHTINIETNITN